MSQNSSSATPGRERRKKKWIPGGPQFRIAAAAFTVGAIVLMLNLQAGLLGLWWIYENPADSVAGVLQQTKEMFIVQFVVVTAATTGFALWVGRSFFHLAGPLYRFKLYFTGLLSGRWDMACRIRSRDHLKDLNDSINAAHKAMAEHMQSQHWLLVEARQLLENGSSGASEDKLQELLARIDSESAEYARRFPDDTPTAVTKTETEPEAQGFLKGASNDPSTNTQAGYQFIVDRAGGFWIATAGPLIPGRTGDRYFYTDASAVIRCNHGAPAGAESRPIGQ